jgi:hypothetical protein
VHWGKQLLPDSPNANQSVRDRILNELVDYCDYYNIPFEHCVDTMQALKVVPMIRGIGFEYVAFERLRRILPSNVWKVEKPIVNAQSAIQDIDIQVTHIPTDQQITIECKLAGKNSFKIPRLGVGTVKIKCMRSRTVGEEAARTLARRYGVSVDSVMRHRDNYRDVDFDFVITSIGNAFWRTTKDGKYVFRLKPEETEFLHRLFGDSTLSVEQLRKKTFDYLLIARSSSLTVSPQNHVRCVRRRCKEAGTSTNCGFIPNYPIVNLNDTEVWRPIEETSEVFRNFLNER